MKRIYHEYVHYLDNKFNRVAINALEKKDPDLHYKWMKKIHWWVEGIAEYMSNNFKKEKINNPKKDQLLFDIENNNGYRGYLRVHAFFESSEELIKVRDSIVKSIRDADLSEFIVKVSNFKTNYADEYFNWLKT